MFCYLHKKHKFGHLQGTQPPINRVTNTDKFVANIINRTLNPAMLAILSKGLNYAQTTRLKSNLEDIISGIEQAIQHLPNDTAEEM
jgi:hypothetical protein